MFFCTIFQCNAVSERCSANDTIRFNYAMQPIIALKVLCALPIRAVQVRYDLKLTNNRAAELRKRNPLSWRNERGAPATHPLTKPKSKPKSKPKCGLNGSWTTSSVTFSRKAIWKLLELYEAWFFPWPKHDSHITDITYNILHILTGYTSHEHQQDFCLFHFKWAKSLILKVN